MAGGHGQLFAAETFTLIHELSQGIPREINRICHNALTLAARCGEKKVTAKALQNLRDQRKV
jgi:type II secretory pathway predicted ATPase ExeA